MSLRTFWTNVPSVNEKSDPISLDVEDRGILLQKLASVDDTKNILVGDEDEKDYD